MLVLRWFSPWVGAWPIPDSHGSLFASGPVPRHLQERSFASSVDRAPGTTGVGDVLEGGAGCHGLPARARRAGPTLTIHSETLLTAKDFRLVMGTAGVQIIRLLIHMCKYICSYLLPILLFIDMLFSEFVHICTLAVYFKDRQESFGFTLLLKLVVSLCC